MGFNFLDIFSYTIELDGTVYIARSRLSSDS